MTDRPSSLRPDLSGRVAVVTGAAQGIGEASALALAELGADLGLCDRETERLGRVAAEAERLGRRVHRATLDVRDEAAAGDFIAGVGSRLGRVDVLVNNAGGGFWAPFTDISTKGRGALVDENFTSVAHFVAATVPLVPDTGGSIINITSVEAFRAAPGFSVYAAMKAAVEQLTKTLALELSGRGIRVNTIAPDGIPTPGDASLAEAAHGEADPSGYGDKVPLGLGTARDVAAAVVYLASDMSLYVTGSTLHVDGGSHAASGWRRGPDGRFHP